MSIIIVAATGDGGVIGNRNKLPWGKPLPEDMKHFREVTLGQNIGMGRGTFESMGSKALKGRKRNIVLTRNKDFSADGVTTMNNKNEVLELAKVEDVFIIGGAEIYKIFIPHAKKMYMTYVLESFSGDVYFPKYNEHDWKTISRHTKPKSTTNPHTLVFYTFERR